MLPLPTVKSARYIAMAGLLVALVALAGCSCKEYEEQIMQLDAQIAQLQEQVADKEAILTEREQLAADLEANLDDCRAEKAVLVEQVEEVVMVTIQDQLAYASSQVIVLDTMVPALEAIARTIRDYPSWDVYVEGYTDDRKIAEEWLEQYPTNWELGAFRATAVVRYMTNQLDLPADQLALLEVITTTPAGQLWQALADYCLSEVTSE